MTWNFQNTRARARMILPSPADLVGQPVPLPQAPGNPQTLSVASHHTFTAALGAGLLAEIPRRPTLLQAIVTIVRLFLLQKRRQKVD